MFEVVPNLKSVQQLDGNQKVPKSFGTFETDPWTGGPNPLGNREFLTNRNFRKVEFAQRWWGPKLDFPLFLDYMKKNKESVACQVFSFSWNASILDEGAVFSQF